MIIVVVVVEGTAGEKLAEGGEPEARVDRFKGTRLVASLPSAGPAIERKHVIVIEVAFSSCGEGSAVTGEGDVTACAPSGIHLYIQFAECICVCLFVCEIDLFCVVNCAETDFRLSLF